MLALDMQPMQLALKNKVSVTIMYMLLGVLVDVIGAVAATVACWQ